MSTLIGQSLGRYHILEQLGEGGMATVYKAYDTRLEADVAVKVIRTENILPSVLDRTLKRFEREAKALARLTHANIVKVTDYGEYEGKPYLVMEYLPSGTLKSKLGKPIPWREAARLLVPVARALAYAHEQGMVHRDVKPSNILITQSGDPMLTDFGIAKIIDEEATVDLTGTSAAVGTPEYMAPEQVTAKSVDHRADIYALGVVFYEMVTGRKPFTADTPMAVLFKHASDPLPRPKGFVPTLPDAVEKVLLKALAKRPEDRYASMSGFANALERTVISEQSAVISKVKEEKVESKQAGPGARPSTDTQATINQMEESIIKERPAPRTPSIQTVAPSSSPGLLRYWPIGLVGVLVIAGLTIALIVALAQATGNRAVPVITEPPVFTEAPTEAPVVTEAPTEAPPALGIGSTWVRPADGMMMVYVPEGEFTMGSNNGDSDEQPIHTVYLDAYWIDQTEVTNAMFTLFVERTGYQTDAEGEGSSYVFDGTNWNDVSGADWQHPQGPSSGLAGLNDHPVVHVSWNDAEAYCGWAGVRLPSEAEWEKAARGIDGRTYPWGNQSLARNLLNFADINLNVDWADRNVDDGYQFTAPVGSYPAGASPYGALDMAGNVWEWVEDWYGETYYSQSPESNPTGPASGQYRVLRGGSWVSYGVDLRSAYRYWGGPDLRNYVIGFRCVLSP